MITGHPLDTIKTRMQMTKHSFSTIIKLSLKNNGFLSFYDGIKGPLYSITFLQAIVFGSFEFSKKIL